MEQVALEAGAWLRQGPRVRQRLAHEAGELLPLVHIKPADILPQHRADECHPPLRHHLVPRVESETGSEREDDKHAAADIATQEFDDAQTSLIERVGGSNIEHPRLHEVHGRIYRTGG